jgi:O-antigen ligase
MLALAVSVGYVVLVATRPAVGMFAVLFIFFLPIGIGGFTLLQLVGVVTAGSAAVWFLRMRQPVALGNLFVPLMLLGVLILISCFYTRDVAKSLFYLRRWAFNMTFYLLLINVVMNLGTLKRVTWAILAASTANAVAGILEFAARPRQAYRSEGLVENQNALGIVSALGFPLALYLFFYSEGIRRWLFLGLAGLLAAGVFVSVSRGSFIALVTTSLFILVMERHRWRSVAIVLAIALLATPLIPRYWFQRMGTLRTTVSETIPTAEKKLNKRGYLNQAGIQMWKAYPVLGVGVGNFGNYLVDREYNPPTKTHRNTVAHNVYVQALAEFGTVGIIIVMWLIVGTVRNLARARKLRRLDPKQWCYFGAIEGMAIVVLVTNMSSGNMLGQGFWAVMGLAATAGSVARREFANGVSED